MAFTGRLGTDDSQLGSILLGGEGVETVEDSFSLDAVIFKVQEAAFTLDAVILKEQSASFNLDAVLVTTTTVNVDLDAVLLKTQAASATADAIVLATQATTFDLDAFLAAPTVEETFTLDATIRATQSASFGLDSYVLGQGHSRLTDHMGTQDDTTITVGVELLRDVLARMFDTAYGIAIPQGRFGLDAFIHPYFNLNAVITQTALPSFTLDAWIARGTTFTLSAIIENVPRSSFTMAAYILGVTTDPGPDVVPGDFDLNAVIV